ncbi:signal-transducing adaptor protein 2 isoform X7 [Sagmatias obliquidens]|uniref:signal-transducing adaptor protein 2 isoform X7 n=1 Tax=Sagmatias obliquidens TaxID=3371155 RepID=UPI000F444DA1|nr:signal-transducing adaptor protein 2 isoform X7 [Lagenorhynchus obliquidens]XP_026941259.1 signal-transducing adaptor protein 2 isoform X7 [Lagenorhynchus obliquidens]
MHMEKLDLGTFVKLTDEAPWGSSHDRGTHFCLVLRNQEIKFKVESLESREMWKGFILMMVELRVPSNLNLLPGHLYMMAEVLAKEEARRALEMPSCFLKVSRLEAQLLLERHPECGNLLLRPSGDGAGGVSVSTLQTLNGMPVVRHYRVKREGPKYVIDVEEPFSCTSLDAVVNYFVSHSNKQLMPFLLDDDYEKVIGYVEADKENGESVWVAPSAPGPGPAAPRGGPKQLPPSSITPVSSQDKLPPLLNQDENYVIPIEDDPAANYVNGDVPSPSRPVVPKPRKLAMFQAKPPKPPIVPKSGRGPSSQPFPIQPRASLSLHLPSPPEPKKGLNSGLARKLAVSSAQASSSPTTGLADVTAELKGKLQRRLALQQAAECTGDQRAHLQVWRTSQADPSSQN